MRSSNSGHLNLSENATRHTLAPSGRGHGAGAHHLDDEPRRVDDRQPAKGGQRLAVALVIDEQKWVLALPRIAQVVGHKDGRHLTEVLKARSRIVRHKAEDVRGLQLELGGQIDRRLRCLPGAKERAQAGNVVTRFLQLARDIKA